MIALLASDLYRTARSRWPWVVLALVALATLGTAVSTIWWPLEPDIVYDGLTGTSGALRLAGRGTSIELVSIVAPFVAAHLSTLDSGTGFDRTLLASLSGRASYFAEKYVLAAILSGALLLAYLAFSGVGALVTMRPVTNVEPLWQFAAWAGEAWLVSCAYALVVLLAGQLTRSRAVTFVVAFLFAGPMAEQMLFSALMLVSEVLGLGWEGAIETAIAWAPYVTLRSVIHGAAELLAADATGVAPALRGLAVCVPLCLGATAIGAAVGARRDLA